MTILHLKVTIVTKGHKIPPWSFKRRGNVGSQFQLAGHHVHLFIPVGAVVSKERYKEVLACLQEIICLKHPEMWVAKDWVLLHDYAWAHQLLLCSNNSPSMVLWCPATHCTYRVSYHAIFTSFPNEGLVDGMSLQEYSRHLSESGDCIKRGHAWWLPEIFWTTLQILTEVCSNWRVIFWRQLYLRGLVPLDLIYGCFPRTFQSCHMLCTLFN